VSKQRDGEAELAVEDTLDIPLEEVSGLCTFQRADGSTGLAAIGDASSVLAVTTITDHGVGVWEEIDLADVESSELPRRGTQAEGLATDGVGLVLVLVEEPGAVFAFDVPSRSQAHRIDLVVGNDQPVARSWGTETNSRGEGIVLLRDGHLLVLKEKDPPALIEFGPSGSSPGGLEADRILPAGEPWTRPDGAAVRFDALATWLLADDLADRLGDASDLAASFDGRLFLLSDQASSVARLATGAPIAGGTVEADQVRGIERSPDKAEGLALLPDGRMYVALDTRKAKNNLLVLISGSSSAR
jgi:uncharacterized protein YjiK